MFRSIRWKFLSWLTLILLVAIAGFGASQYYLVQSSRMHEVDAELEGAAHVLVEKLRRAPPWRRPGGFKPGPPRESWDAALDFINRGEGFSGRGRRELGRGRGPGRKSDRHARPFWPGWGAVASGTPDRTRFLAELSLPDSLLQRFGEGDETPYFAIWRPGDRVLTQSGTPEGFELPRPPEGGDSEPFYVHEREERREVVMAAPYGIDVVVGRSIRKELSELRRLAMSLFGTGVAVLLLGIAGGWFIAGRAIRPIQAISSAAESISASNFSRRIDIENTETELGSLASVLNSTFDRLQEAFQDQVRFTADASHELRTPVAAILAQTAMARRRPRSPEEYREVIDACYVVAKRMKSLVDGLLTLARTDAESLELRREEFDLRTTAEECSTMVEAIAVSRGISLETDLAPAVLHGDPDRVSQVVTNLLTNAVRYNRDGGRVSVALREDGSDVVLSVSDTGVGIAPADQEKIFDRFYRVDKARARRVGGSGLGLAISKAIIEAHGGTIACWSDPRTGTTFVVRVPRGGDVSDAPRFVRRRRAALNSS